MSVTGLIHPDDVVAKTGGTPGCELVLTKPLGMGILSSGIKEGVTSESTTAEAIAIMSTLNKDASGAMVEVGVAAATDVTGFGLIGHLLQMLGPASQRASSGTPFRFSKKQSSLPKRESCPAAASATSTHLWMTSM